MNPRFFILIKLKGLISAVKQHQNDELCNSPEIVDDFVEPNG